MISLGSDGAPLSGLRTSSGAPALMGIRTHRSHAVSGLVVDGKRYWACGAQV